MASEPEGTVTPPAPDASGSREPPSVRIIRGATRWASGNQAAAARALLAAATVGWLVTGLYTVGNGQSAAVTRFGSLTDDTAGPGLHLSMPSGIDRVVREQTGEIKRMEVNDLQGAPLALVTGDENLIEMTLVVQYRISALGPYLYSSEDPQGLISRAVRGAVVQAVARLSVDDVLTTAKAQIQNEVRETAQGLLSSYDTGISLLSVNLQAVSPPAEVADAFRQVNDAKAGAAQAINEAGGRRERDLTLARGEAEQAVAEAQAWAQKRTQEAQGKAARFASVLTQKIRAPEQARTDFYLAMARSVLPKVKIVVLAPGAAPRIDVNIVPKPGGGR